MCHDFYFVHIEPRHTAYCRFLALWVLPKIGETSVILIVQAQNVGLMSGHSAVVFGLGSHGSKVLVLFGGRTRFFGEDLSETTKLLLSKYIEMVVVVC